ncbi:MAG: L-seryl-tRNA(Sec) selenium transferase [Planctomycetota bacterium]
MSAGDRTPSNNDVAEANGRAAAANDRRDALRRLPAVDVLLRSVPDLGSADSRRDVARELLDEERVTILNGSDGRSVEELSTEVANRMSERLRPVHRRVRNATGIVLHTGLGRAPLSEKAVEAVQGATGSAVVEVDLPSLERNHREHAVRSLLCDLTGSEAALVVNNNAAAVHLGLSVLARGREVIVSRGELVEIGGGFRMPDVMREAGCRMVEVGATNKTRVEDYERAIGPETAAIVKVHPSNFRIEGFASTPTLHELAALGRRHGVPVFEDLGSGLLTTPVPTPLRSEPHVIDSVRSGAELVCFSGDKLLGGPQAGIFVGTKEWVDHLRRAPMYRAFRCDKLTLAALEATLRSHRDGDPLLEIPTLRRIARSPADLRAAADQVVAGLRDDRASTVATESFVGSGAHAAKPIPSAAVALEVSPTFSRRLRTELEFPIVARQQDGRVLLDLRTLYEEDLDALVADLRSILQTEPRSGSN